MESPLLFALLSAGLLGIVGQGLRVIVGVRKSRAEAAATATSFRLKGGELAFSLLIGFVAGVLAWLSLRFAGVADLDNRALGEVIAAGYAGTDFIEGFIKRYPQRAAPPEVKAG